MGEQGAYINNDLKLELDDTHFMTRISVYT